MHNTVLSDLARRAFAGTRGDCPPLSLDPARTALVVIDLQVGMAAPGAIHELPMNREITPTVNRLASTVRHSGGTNVFLRFTYDPGWTSWYGRMLPSVVATFAQTYAPGSPQHDVWPEVQVDDSDLVLNKTRQSAFIPGTCELNDELKSRDIDTLLIAGCFSNACCESTARDAVQMNYRVVFVSDANAAFSDELHNGAANNLHMSLGCDIATADEVIQRLRSGAASLP